MSNTPASSTLLDADHPDFLRITAEEATELGQRALEAVGAPPTRRTSRRKTE